jgi:putative Mg2+ transporter-C (MgtC) family protein
MISIFNNPEYHPYFLLFLAAVCGGALGTERQNSGHREAGRRTLALVSLGSCLFSILPMMMGAPDPWRVAGQVVTGIGFIGGGVLIKENLSIKGLTTSATIWISAAIGIAFSADKILLGIFCTVFTFLILRIKKEPMEYFNKNKENN